MEAPAELKGPGTERDDECLGEHPNVRSGEYIVSSDVANLPMISSKRIAMRRAADGYVYDTSPRRFSTGSRPTAPIPDDATPYSARKTNKFDVDYRSLESVKQAVARFAPGLSIAPDFTQHMLDMSIIAARNMSSLSLCPFVNADGTRKYTSIIKVISGNTRLETVSEKRDRIKRLMVARPKSATVLHKQEHNVIQIVAGLIGVKLTNIRECRMFDFHGPPDANLRVAYGQIAVATVGARRGTCTGKTIGNILSYLEHGGIVFIAIITGGKLGCAYVIKPSDRDELASNIEKCNISMTRAFAPTPFPEGRAYTKYKGGVSLTGIMSTYRRDIDEVLMGELAKYFMPGSDAPRHTVEFLNEDPTMVVSVDILKESAYIERLRLIGLEFQLKDFGNGDGGGDIILNINGTTVTPELKKATPGDADTSYYYCQIRQTSRMPINVNNVSSIWIAVPNTRESIHGESESEKKRITDLLTSPSHYGVFILLATRSVSGASLIKPNGSRIGIEYSRSRRCINTSQAYTGGDSDRIVISMTNRSAKQKIFDFALNAENRVKMSATGLSEYLASVDYDKEQETMQRRRKISRKRKQAALNSIDDSQNHE